MKIIILLLLILIFSCSPKDYREREFICTKIDCGNENIDELVEQERKNL